MRIRMALTLPLAIMTARGDGELQLCTSTTPDHRALTAIWRDAQGTLGEWFALLRPGFPNYEPALGIHAAVHRDKPAGALLSVCGPDMKMPWLRSTEVYAKLKELALAHDLSYIMLDLEKDGSKLKYRSSNYHYPFTVPSLTNLKDGNAFVLQMDYNEPSLRIINSTEEASAVCFYPSAERETQSYRLETAIKEGQEEVEATLKQVWADIKQIKRAYDNQQCSPISMHWPLDLVKGPASRRTPSAESFLRSYGQFNRTAEVIRGLAALITAEPPTEWYEEVTNVILMSAGGGTALVLAGCLACVCYLRSLVMGCLGRGQEGETINANNMVVRRPGYVPARPALPATWLPVLR